jgi:hypothetical protein
LGRILFKLFGVGKPRALQCFGGLAALVQLVILLFQRVCETISSIYVALEPLRTNSTARLNTVRKPVSSTARAKAGGVEKTVLQAI